MNGQLIWARQPSKMVCTRSNYVHRLEKELHGDNRCELSDEKDVLFQPPSLMELSHILNLGT